MKKFDKAIPTNARLNLVVALPCEARPFIKYFSLKKVSIAVNFVIYKNQNETIHLIVSGVGKVKMAAATTFLHAFTGCHENSVYLNIGIAGSKNYALGELIGINKITDEVTAQSYFPSAFLLNHKHQAALMTFDSPQTTYPDNVLVDMEGSGFFQAATMLVSQEQVQLLKTISDNCISSIKTIKPNRVEALLNANIGCITDIIARLADFSSQQTLPHKPWMNLFLKQWHFTYYQQHALDEILRRWQVLVPDQNPLFLCEQLPSSQVVLKKLTQHLDQLNYIW